LFFIRAVTKSKILATENADKTHPEGLSLKGCDKLSINNVLRNSLILYSRRLLILICVYRRTRKAGIKVNSSAVSSILVFFDRPSSGKSGTTAWNFAQNSA
jgi:hypothetical protein